MVQPETMGGTVLFEMNIGRSKNSNIITMQSAIVICVNIIYYILLL